MLDDIFEFAADALLDISDWKTIHPRAKHVLEIVGIALGLTSMVLFFVLR